jgi:hypothetical protein
MVPMTVKVDTIVRPVEVPGSGWMSPDARPAPSGIVPELLRRAKRPCLRGSVQLMLSAYELVIASKSRRLKAS